MTQFFFDELPIGSQVSIQTTDRGVISATSVAMASSSGLDWTDAFVQRNCPLVYQYTAVNGFSANTWRPWYGTDTFPDPGVGNRPILTLPELLFDGVNDRLVVAASIAISDPMHILVVGRWQAGGQGPMFSNNIGTDILLARSGDDVQFVISGDLGAITRTVAQLESTHVYEFMTDSSGTAKTAFIDRVTSLDFSGSASGSTLSSLAVATDTGTTTFGKVGVDEIWIWRGNLPTTMAQTLVTALIAKHTITP